MVNYRFLNKISFLRKQPDAVNIILIYRCLTLLIISIFYLTTQIDHTFRARAFIVICIAISSAISGYLYIKVRGNTTKIILLLVAETIGNSFILIPSGGISSPYVWYSLNTILIASIELDRKFCWLNLGIYIFVSNLASYFIINGGRKNLFSIIYNESDIILSLVLITMAIQILSKYMKKLQSAVERLKELNVQLLSANKKIKELMNYSLELYQTVHLFSTSTCRSDLIKLIVQFTRKITKIEDVIFYSFTNIENSNPDMDNNCISEIVKSESRSYGLLCVGLANKDATYSLVDTKEQLKFIAELSSIVLERYELEMVNEKLLISEEQNRIANEIHDSVLQKLFSVSCGLFGMIKSQSTALDRETSKQLNIIRGYVDDTIKDLRSAVYGLSWKKGGSNSFIIDVNKYIDEIRKLNSTDINFNTDGYYEMLSSSQKSALYRIICEGIGNAVRHGKASHIDISLSTENSMTLLTIYDNGIGFNLREIRQSNKLGLGIKNIYELVKIHNGKVDWNSAIGKGTGIKILIPSISTGMYKEDIV